jgi:hypothetical protein
MAQLPDSTLEGGEGIAREPAHAQSSASLVRTRRSQLPRLKEPAERGLDLGGKERRSLLLCDILDEALGDRGRDPSEAALWARAATRASRRPELVLLPSRT